jgi:hypothetical protein
VKRAVAERKGRSEAEVCTSAAQKIRVPLVAPGMESIRRLGFVALSGAREDGFTCRLRAGDNIPHVSPLFAQRPRCFVTIRCQHELENQTDARSCF